jgi:Transposase DDE domain group 1
VSSPARAAAAEHWYRHRTTVENIFRDSRLGAALRRLPSGYHQVNLAWMWGALLAATMAAWLHQLTATALGEDIVHGHGVRDGKAMIATLRRRLIAVPGRLIRHARHLILRLPPATACSPRSWPGCGHCPPSPDLHLLSPGSPSWSTARQPRPQKGPAKPRTRRRPPGCHHARYQKPGRTKIIYTGRDQPTALFAESGLTARLRPESSRLAGGARAAHRLWPGWVAAASPPTYCGG